MIKSLLWFKPQTATGRIILLCTSLIVVCVLFLTWNAKASWAFTLEFRGQKLITLMLVGAFISVATLLFQTISQNRILTPSILGFDALYILIQSALVITFGVSEYASFHPVAKWAFEILLMTGMMLMLYQRLFKGTTHSLHIMIISGVVLGICLSSVNGLVLRLMDPSQAVVAQDAFFATFASASPELLQIAIFVSCVSMVFLFINRHRLDVLYLGEQTARSVGVDYPRINRQVLILVSILIGMSTALVGPISFLGLLVVHLTYRLAGSYRHAILIPFSALVGMLTLIVGEFVLQHLVSFNTRLSIIVECLGGLLFLGLVLKQAKS